MYTNYILDSERISVYKVQFLFWPVQLSAQKMKSCTSLWLLIKANIKSVTFSALAMASCQSTQWHKAFGFN